MYELLPLLPCPSHYTGLEDGAYRKDVSTVHLHIALAFPDLYEVGMSYLGQKILYGIVNAHKDWLAERVMAPKPEVAKILQAHNAPLTTLESDTPLQQLDCVAFSVTHELCYTNILYMLDLAGIPLHTSERSQDLNLCPLIIAGGGALLSAEPLAPFIDLMALGDGEEMLPEILQLLEHALSVGWTRNRFLLEARNIPGVYIPSFFLTCAEGSPTPLLADYTRPTRRIVADLNKAQYPVRQVVPIGAVHNRLALEIARGCTRGCRFCHAGIVYRPVRERSLQEISRLLEACLKETGFEEISFLSLSTGDFSALKTLSRTTFERCLQEQISFSLPSQRVGSIDEEILGRIALLRRTGMTLAPEAGSQRLRDVINKGVTEEALLLHAQKILEYGWKAVKLYFMLGLPTETEEDLQAIVDLCCKVRNVGGSKGSRLQVTISISPFVPKPFTPFQWAEQISVAEMQKRINFIRALSKNKKGLTVHWHEPAMSHLEGLLSRAGRQMATVVEKAYRKGAIFCSWMEYFTLEPWLEALQECGLKAEDCIAGLNLSAPLPWDHLESGVSKKFLQREWHKALAGQRTEDCRYASCQGCGACDSGQTVSLLKKSAKLAPHTPLFSNRLNLATRDQDVPQSSERTALSVNTQLIQRAVQYRIWHTKTERSAFFSQLELQSVVERALRRATLPVSFSQGFHPMPLVSFGRALPVGVESQEEWFALTLHTFLSAGVVKAKLASFLPVGFELLRLERIDDRTRIILSDYEVFRLSFRTEQYKQLALRCFENFFNTSEYLYTYETKKGSRKVNLRPLLKEWQAESSDTLALSFTTDWRQGYISPLKFCLAILTPLGTEEELYSLIKLLKIQQLFER